uniref:Uncharacterized protein n=1 Tax=viral metagenome TaxID=1070528 RepID=A0A2V0RK25_9ZZZZ
MNPDNPEHYYEPCERISYCTACDNLQIGHLYRMRRWDSDGGTSIVRKFICDGCVSVDIDHECIIQLSEQEDELVTEFKRIAREVFQRAHDERTSITQVSIEFYQTSLDDWNFDEHDPDFCSVCDPEECRYA